LGVQAACGRRQVSRGPTPPTPGRHLFRLRPPIYFRNDRAGPDQGRLPARPIQTRHDGWCDRPAVFRPAPNNRLVRIPPNELEATRTICGAWKDRALWGPRRRRWATTDGPARTKGGEWGSSAHFLHYRRRDHYDTDARAAWAFRARDEPWWERVNRLIGTADGGLQTC